MTSERIRGTAGAWPAIAALVVGTALWMAVAGLGFDWRSAALPAVACIGLEGLAAFYRIRRPDVRLAATLTALAQIVAFTGSAAALSYAVASTGGPLWDDTLQSWDRALGLDWRAYLDFVNARPWLGLLYTLAYQSLTVQLILVVTVLGFGGHLRAVREFVFALVMAGVTTVLISGLMPAMAMFVQLGLKPQDYPHLDPAAAFVHVAALSGLRDGTLQVISLSHAEGIITFPSFHAALGVLFVMALWPVRLIRWPALGLNILLVAATPIDGGHYFVDIAAGGAIALLAMGVAHRLCRGAANGTPAVVGRPSKEPCIEA